LDDSRSLGAQFVGFGNGHIHEDADLVSRSAGIGEACGKKDSRRILARLTDLFPVEPASTPDSLA
jgi:hypothetical protein